MRAPFSIHEALIQVSCESGFFYWELNG